ncbi:MAG: SUKH-4 family immunity protein [Candidatus Methylacidiphilales bacterium]
MKWNDNFGEIIIYSVNRIDKFGFNNSTAKFLKTSGLPKDAAPFLSFSKDNYEIYEGLLKLTDYFNFLEPEFDKYMVIGSTGNGDEIVIDIKDDCKIKILDHEDNFSEEFANSTIEKFANGLLLYQEFIESIIRKNGENALIEFNYNNNQIEDLKQKMIFNDKDSMNLGCFWNQELEILIANKK